MNPDLALALRLRQRGAVTLARAPEGYDAFVIADLVRALAKEAEKPAGRADVRRARRPARAEPSSTRSPSPRPRSKRSICPPGIASPTIASRPMRRSRRPAWSRSPGSPRRAARGSGRACSSPPSMAPRSACRPRRSSPPRRSRPRPATCSTWPIWCAGWSRTAFPAPASSPTSAITRSAAAFSISIRRASRRRSGSISSATRWNRSARSIPRRSAAIGQLRALDLAPMSEAQLTTETIRRFRQGYALEFGAPRRGDALYETLSEGRRAIGLEHWLPLFYERLDTRVRLCRRRAASCSTRARRRRPRAGSRRSPTIIRPANPPTTPIRRPPTTSR